ncbi:MAG: tRNA pseudouridine(55) synthase TruB [Proteobacteria bacterium]|nr:tRNA pseudouridine(55) synthase TruB [Pseudomonadota bacterium]
MNGILLLNKPADITSFKAIEVIKKHFKIKKIGHAGTLDSFATGLLIIGINEGTKVLKYYVDLDKEYETVFQLGESTDTYDINGEKTYIHKGKYPEIPEIEKVLKGFEGEIEQVPPKYSALKINGIRASDRVRKGMEVNLTPRIVRIDYIKVIEYKERLLSLKIKCSKGTYIRAIARDLGERLGCGAYVKELKRTKVGLFDIKESVSLDELLEDNKLDRYLVPLVDSLPFIQKLILEPREINEILNGRPIYKDIVLNSSNFLGVNKNKAIAVLKLENINGRMGLKPDRVLFDR